MKRKMHIVLLAIGSLLVDSPLAFAQDVVLTVSTTIGDAKAQLKKHTVTAGKESPIYSGPLYRVLVTPTVATSEYVDLAFRVFNAASGELQAAPRVRAQIGKIASISSGTKVSATRMLYDWQIDVTANPK